jgi:hypothetical protein
MGSSKGPDQAEIEAAQKEKARLEELRRNAELSRLSRGRAQRNLGAERVDRLFTATKVGPRGRPTNILETITVVPLGGA